MLSIRTQKSIAWFFFCGALSSLVVSIFGIVYSAATARWGRTSFWHRLYAEVSGVFTHVVYWPLTLFVFFVVSALALRRLYRKEPSQLPRKFRIYLLDLVIVSLIFAALMAILGSPREELFTVALPPVAVLSVSVLLGFIHVNRMSVDNNPRRTCKGLAAGFSLLARLVIGGLAVTCLCTLPFTTIADWSGYYLHGPDARIWYLTLREIVDDPFDRYWPVILITFGASAAPLSLFFTWLARYSAGNAKSQEN